MMAPTEYGPSLANVLAGTRLTCLWNGTAWTYNGQAVTARPTARHDIYFDLADAPASTADPSWMLAGDQRVPAAAPVVWLTQPEYDALASKDPATTYVIAE